MRNYIIGILLLVLFLGGAVGYIRWDAVQEERTEIALQQAEEYRRLNDKYNDLSTKYNKLKAAKEVKRQGQVVREDKLIYENREYYAGDCFDAAGLQHIQEAQSTSAK